MLYPRQSALLAAAYTLELGLQCAPSPAGAAASCREAPEDVQELVMLRQPEP